jgi:hypothetical protein
VKEAIAIAIAIAGIAKLQFFINDYSIYDERTYKVNV